MFMKVITTIIFVSFVNCGLLLDDHNETKGFEKVDNIEGTIGDNIKAIQIHTLNDTPEHIVMKQKIIDLSNDYMPPAILKNANVEIKRQRRSAPSVVKPEILVVVDSTLYAKLGKDTSAVTQYITNFWSALNLRFRTISNPRVELNIADIVISNTPADTPYLKNSKVSSKTFNAATALDLMAKHYYKAASLNLPIFDLVVALTALDMCTMEGSSCKKNTAGYAYVGGACDPINWLQKSNSVAIVEDNGGYSGVVIAAHEVAHLLGAVHDGDSPLPSIGGPGASSCSWSNGYIMGNNRRTERGLRWSKCTKNQLTHFLSTPTASCLYNTPHSNLYPLQDHAHLINNVLSPDEQCYKEAGTKSCSYYDSRVCTQLFCLNPATGGCISYRPAVDGSQCGDGKVCKDGQCTRTSAITKHHPIRVFKKVSKTKDNSKAKLTNFSVKPLNSRTKTCHDSTFTNCNKLFKSFSFIYCGNKQIQKICCASHALFCNK
eukprot:GFUD01005956.1.p1 GENE.GFUD01005956.1~~GFUD01005956.1.p1  ORF type:complete len:489 (-),score=121.51 GFUD01005956.1:182-1648(-)